ncbi:MAG: hypothetical protein IJO57_01205 [Bacilli bacterium]|nr:hypothetical protein [Bacilli bacterium]
MKEATGELNMTVVTVLVVVALGAIATTVIIPAISTGMRNSTCQSMLNDNGASARKSGNDYYCCPSSVSSGVAGCTLLDD